MMIHDTKDVYVAWTNTDTTEGRGYEYPLAVCELKATAERLGQGKGVQGTNCSVTKDIGIRIDHQWYYPGKFIQPTEEDKQLEMINKAKVSAMLKAKEAGLTDEEIKLLST